jgi:hypothetical protein
MTTVRRFPIPRAGLAALLLALPLGAGCGGEETDVSGGVAEANRQLGQQGVRLDCPKKVDGGEGTEFDCTMRGIQTGKSTKIKLKVRKEGGSLGVDFAGDRAEVQGKLREVTS